MSFVYRIVSGVLALAAGMSATGPATAAQPVCDVTKYGAQAGDTRLDTAAVQQAIDACKDRGGRVVVPAGRYVVGQLRLGSTMELHLAPGAVLAASTDLAQFPVVDAIGSGNAHRPFIVGLGVRDVSITGMGTIDGSGPSYWGKEDVDRIRFGLIMQACRNVRVRDITIRDTPMFLMAVMGCDNVVIDGVTLTAPLDSPNTDGLQIIDSNDVRVSNAFISVGDDGIVTKAHKRVIERLQVVNTTIASDDGAIKFGTRSESGVRDSLFSNIVIANSRYGIALFMIHGGIYENNRFSNIRIATGGRHARHYPIFVDVDDRARRPADQGTEPTVIGSIRGLTFDGIDITTAGNILIGGHPRSPVTDLTMTDIRMRVARAQSLPGTAGKPRGNRTFKAIPGSPDHSGVNAHIVLGHVDDATLRGIDVRGLNTTDTRPTLATPCSTRVKGESK